jgi:uncharacterized membrane protein
MNSSANLWAVAYDDHARMEQTRAVLAQLGEQGKLKLLDTAVGVRQSEGAITLDGEPFLAGPSLHESRLVRFLAGLIFAAPPLTGSATTYMLGTAGMHCPTETGIDAGFVSEVAKLMRPGTSVLFVLDQAGDMDAILGALRGLGGNVLKTNVDLQRAELIQSALRSRTQLG